MLSVQLDYLPVCGNASTVLCYLLCLLLNLRYVMTRTFIYRREPLEYSHGSRIHCVWFDSF